MNKMNPKPAGKESEPRVPTDLRKAFAVTPMAKAQSLLDACGRKASPLLLFNSVIQPLHSPRGYPEGEGPVERSHADGAQGFY